MRNFCPLSVHVPITSSSPLQWNVVNARFALQDALIAALIQLGPPEGAMRAQCNPRALEEVVGRRLPLSFKLHPVSYSHVLDVIEADGQVRCTCRPDNDTE